MAQQIADTVFRQRDTIRSISLFLAVSWGPFLLVVLAETFEK